jgi:hypothetical protein
MKLFGIEIEIGHGAKAGTPSGSRTEAKQGDQNMYVYQPTSQPAKPTNQPSEGGSMININHRWDGIYQLLGD